MTDGFDFDEVIDRRAVPTLKVHRMVLGDGNEDLFAAGVADMDFRAPPVVRRAMAARLAHGVFGYEAAARGVDRGADRLAGGAARLVRRSRPYPARAQPSECAGHGLVPVHRSR